MPVVIARVAVLHKTDTMSSLIEFKQGLIENNRISRQISESSKNYYEQNKTKCYKNYCRYSIQCTPASVPLMVPPPHNLHSGLLYCKSYLVASLLKFF